ncbi:MAG TPA: apolipoprotein N-acyltransferase [Chthonomonadaceae bacterium]|nr:apolipoprotein N-acyltransferase [Chthonomonadaceae bacterium]
MTTGDTIIADTDINPQASPQPKRLPGLRLALLSSVLLWLANPGHSLWLLAWVGLTPLLLSVTRATRFRQAFWRGYVFGCIYLGAVWYWIWLTVNSWSQSDIGVLAWALLTLILALYYGVWGGLAWWLSRRTTGLWRMVALAASWVLLEWVRTLGSCAMPWAQLSYTQYHVLPILQISELTGAYGVTFLIVLVNAALMGWWERRGEGFSPPATLEDTENTEGTQRKNQGRSACLPLWVAGVSVAAVFGYGLIRMTMPEGGTPLTVAAMQGNFSANVHPDPLQTLQVVSDLTRKAAQQNPTPMLYVWGESTAKDVLHYPPSHIAFLDMARQYHAAVTVGTVLKDWEKVDGKDTLIETNSAVLFPQDGSPPQLYDKTQMVPFGEFIPLRSLLGSIMEKQFDFPSNDLVFGGHATPQTYTDPGAGRVSLGPFICYESMFPQMARAMTRQGANLLVTQSNDDWFQSNDAMEQHLSAVVLRAIENRRDIARSTTTGVSCLLDSKGQVLQRAPTHTPAFVVATLHLLDGQTLYVRLGDWFVALCLALVLGALWKSRHGK